MTKPIDILIVEHCAADVDIARRAISRVLENCVFHVVETPAQFCERLRACPPDVILADCHTEGFNGLQSLELAQKYAPMTPIIVWVDLRNERETLECIESGAANYVIKEHVQRLGPAVLHALKERDLLLARKQAEEQYQAIFENSVIGIFQSSPQGRFLHANAALARIYGYDSAQELIDSIQDIASQIYVDADRRADFQEQFQSCDTIENYEQRNYRKDGSIIWTSTHARAVRHPDGRISYYEGFITDITARKQAEASLRERERQLSMLFSNLPGPVYRCLNNAEYSMEFISDGIEELSGYPAEDFRRGRRHFGELIHLEDRQRVWAEIQSAVEHARPFELTYRITTASGEEKWVWEKGQSVPGPADQPGVLEGFITDITERKQAEDKLLRSQKELDEAQRVAKIGSWVYDIAQNHVHWSYGLYRIFGVDRAEFDHSYDSFLALIHPEDRMKARPTSLHTLSDGSPFQLEYRILTPAGELKYISEIGYAVKDADGQIVSLFGTAQDITQRKQAESRINDLLVFNEKILNYSSIGILTYTASGSCVFANEKAASIIGAGVEQLVQQNFRKLPSWKESGLLDLVEQCLATQTPLSRDIHVISTFGRDIWMTAHCVAFTSKGEEHVILCITDISDRKQVEATLRYEKERFERITATVPGILCSLRLRPDGSTCMPFASPAIQDVYGLLPADVQEDATPLMSRIHPDDVRETNRLIEESARSMHPWHSEFRYLHPTKGEVWIEGQAMPVSEEDGSIIWHGFVHDVTERKRAEAAEREQRALAEALRDTAETLSRTLDYGAVLDHILTAVGRVVPHDAASIMLIENGLAHIVRAKGFEQHAFEEKIRDIKLPVAQTANLRLMFETGEPLVIYDTHTYPGWKQMVETDWLRSNVGAPISIYGDVIGFILLDSEAPEFFKPVHAERLQSFANQAALAIHNARLLQQAQQEIAERKQAEQELRASEERFRQLAENLEEAFWMTDAVTGRELYMSPAVETIWGRPISYQMQVPDSFINSILPSDRHGVLRCIEREKKGQRMELEYRIVRPDGTLRWLWDRAFPILDESGQVIRIAGITADITERRESELALIKSQSRYRELFDSSPSSLWEEDYSLVKREVDRLVERGVTDLESYFRQHPEEVAQWAALVRVVDVNQASLDLYHASSKEELIKPLSQILSPDALTEFHQEILGFLGPTRRFERERMDPRPDGDKMQVMAAGAVPHGYEQDWSKVIISLTDITERKRTEEAMRRRAEETAALLQTSLALTNLDLKATLQAIGSSAKNLFNADGCRVFLMESDGETLRCVLALQENFTAFSNLRIRLGEGVTGAVAASGRAEIVNEMHNDTRSVQVPGTPDQEQEAIMFAPLKDRDQTIGVLSIRRAGPDVPFLPGDLELLAAFASMAASAVSKARLFEETQRRLAELEALYENGLAVGRLLKPEEIGNRVIETFAHYLRWHHVTIRLRRGDSDDLELVSFNLPHIGAEQQARTQQQFVQYISKVGQGLSGHVIQTGRPLRTGNVLEHPQYIGIQEGIHSGLYMPLKVGDRVIGVISVESEVPDAFTEQDERLLATLASQAAIAFENARLYQAIEQELTERKRAQEALRVSETHYRELADSITDILYELDHDLHYTHWNKASELLTGVPAHEAIGRSMNELFGTSAEQLRIGRIYEDVLEHRQPRTFETQVALNGEMRYFEINAYPSTRGVSVVANDVTQRKRSESIMQKRFELMDYAADHTLGELMQKTTDAVSELTGSALGFFHFVEPDQLHLGLRTWSTSTVRAFNIPADLEAPAQVEQEQALLETMRQRQPVIQNDYEAFARERGLPLSPVCILRQIAVPVLRNEKVVAVLGIANKPQDYTQDDLEIAWRLADYAWDITERKQMELALEQERCQLVQRVEERTADLSRANSNLARALRVKDEFLANMSHELRTPLNAILGLSESLGEQIAGPLNEKQQKYITTISESGHHLLALINDILDLAKIEAGQITLDINKADIHTVCQSSLRMVKQLAQRKCQEVILDIEDGLGLMWADERRLKQMIVNLLGNAVKFTPENGQIGLQVRGDRDANKITITVWDTGIGIGEEDLNRLFRPFVQLDSGLARETTGTGLGLALVAQMARLHGGSVQATSELGKGSRFSIVVPWEPALALDTAARLRVTGKFPAIKPNAGKRPTVLLVEDTREVTMMVQDYLELAGYQVVTAQDGVDGLVQARLAHPDLILMDVQMPRMDGLEATRKLRSEAEFRYTPVIALTALAMPSDRERCLAAGMDEYVSKPVNLKALAKLIQSCLFHAAEAQPQ